MGTIFKPNVGFQRQVYLSASAAVILFIQKPVATK
jgi:hypothetical protein